uniref:C2H2-type domain-containing protein n=1 Tax=Prolemur simus TaxID=1328070 RepID=A0A8C8ZVR9_PROSS
MTELASSGGGSPAGDGEEGLGDERGLVIHHPAEEQPHRCPLCGQTFSQLPSLVRHQKAHAGAGRTAAFVCPECGKAFSVKHNLEMRSGQDLTTLKVQGTSGHRDQEWGSTGLDWHHTLA